MTSAAAADEIILKDEDGSGDLKLHLKVRDADDTRTIDLSETPAVFPNGIHVNTITAGMIVTLILKTGE
jgi:hypothetical protein